MPSTTSSPDSEVDHVDPRDELCRLLGYQFTDPRWLDLALRHRSWCAENGAVASNERLEFLGDSVLGLVVTDHLFRAAPDTSEGVLARHRSELVSAAALAEVARSVQLGAALALGKGEESTGGRNKTSILADGMEAVIGGVYLDGGIGASTTLVLHLLEDRIGDVLYGGLASDHKSRLQELAAHRFGHLPRYLLSEDGPEHEKHFWARVELGGTEWGRGEGRTKKEAEQAAARRAFERLQKEPDDVTVSVPDAATANRRAAGDGEPVDGGTTSSPAGTTPGGNHA
ncbi:MAG: ribonuclease III [Microthrixaceae bacterium]